MNDAPDMRSGAVEAVSDKAASSRGQSIWRWLARGFTHILTLALITGFFIISPAIGLAFGGLWALVTAIFMRLGMKRRMKHTRQEWHEREAYLLDRIEHLSDQVFELQDREGRYRSLIEKQSDIMFRRDRDGALSFVNDAFSSTFGVTEADVVGTSYRFKVREGELPEVSCHRPRRLSYDVCLQTAKGARWFAFDDFMILDERGGLLEIQYVGRDVTERHEAQENLRQARREAESAARAKSRFLATMSHEIRTPLNGVLGMAGLLSRTPLTPEQKAYVSAISSSGESLLTLIDDILDFSRLDAGKVKLAMRPFDLTDLCEEVVELMAPKAHAKALEIGLYVSREVSGRFEGDAARLRQILLNLVGNAVKFTEVGGVSVSVMPHPKYEDGIEIVVADTGPGVPDDARSAIFREFEQAEQGPARRYGGTGLGLAISSRLVRLMRGDIELSTSSDRGATFSVRLPLVRMKLVEPIRTLEPAPRVLLWTSLGLEAGQWATSLREHGFIVSRASGMHTPEDANDLTMADIVVFDSGVLETFPDILSRVSGRRIVALRPDERQGILPKKALLPVDGFLIRPVRQDALMQLARPQRSLGEADAAGADPAAAIGYEIANPLLPEFGALSGAKQWPEQKKTQVLVAEDNDINALLTAKLLESMDCEVTRVTDGLEAVEAISNRAYDLVLMDLHMPFMDGQEAARTLIKTLERDGRTSPPIIALTANSSAEDRERSFASGMVDFIVKPVSPDMLRTMLAKWVWSEDGGEVARDAAGAS